MNVKTILAAKGGDIIGIEPTANLAAAAKLLSKHRIGAVVIRGAGGRLAGILSERDIVRAMAEHGAAALDIPVGQAMTRNVMTCGENDSIAELMERMTSGNSVICRCLMPSNWSASSRSATSSRCACRKSRPTRRRCGITSRPRDRTANAPFYLPQCYLPPPTLPAESPGCDRLSIASVTVSSAFSAASTPTAMASLLR